MLCNDVKPWLRVRTVKLGETTGMLIAEKHLNCRRAGVTGTVQHYVPGHGGDVWFVAHDDGTVGAYRFTELEPVDCGEQLELTQESRHYKRTNGDLVVLRVLHPSEPCCGWPGTKVVIREWTICPNGKSTYRRCTDNEVINLEASLKLG